MTRPVSVAIEASGLQFQLYPSSGGMITNQSTCSNSINHAVVAVGYNMAATPPYYIVRNSWGSGWGDKGYFKMQIDDTLRRGTCLILDYPKGIEGYSI